ncbi:Predicted thiol-disulfide oxidoreductase YuxK, DCC family [Lutibacter oricola]|uniref:Predicted thiol-disulfide oxidoreductase YuxK, DCC family n=1 Tax=Lutibacter oricola TaxID=762486 RepID=A0A1H2W0H5_9FLAO|nr:DCC1-like thiol-disulfide oxidoreductase family protein [Lutibacter oricola]SDW74162.1 Predicted thiol-disulfide oxidoreductase YuxK, DCC family [Lutibacter oricola]
MKKINNKSIVLFDGVCNLCNSSINFIIKHDTKERFLFASLQSDAAKEILLQFTSKKNDLSSILYIENNKLYSNSSAALRISKYLRTPINWMYAFIIVPKFIRNAVYNYIAKNRYKWYGKKESCMIPSPELKKRFL